MTTLNKLAAALSVCAALTAAGAQSLPRIDRESDARPRELISEGLGVGRIYVWRSTFADVIAVYGKDYKLVDHGGSTEEIRYVTRDLSFWYCHDDPQKRIFDIQATAPFNGFTARGIVLGKSTLGDVVKAYGTVNPSTTSMEDEWTFRYPGIEFTVPYKKIDKKPVSALYGMKVTTIDVITSNWGADCIPPNLK